MIRVLVILLFFLATSAKAQKFHINFLGGATVSSSSLKDYKRVYYSGPSDDFKQISLKSKIKPILSFYGGVKMDYDLSNSISLSSKVLLENVGFIHKIDQSVFTIRYPDYYNDTLSGKDHIKLLYFSIPLQLVFYAPLQRSKLFVGVGGFGSYGLFGTSHFKTNFSSNNAFTVKDSIVHITFNNSGKVKYASYHANRFDYGISVIGGIEFRNNFFIELGYESGFLTIMKDRFIVGTGNNISHNFSNKRRAFKAGVGFRIK